MHCYTVKISVYPRIFCDVYVFVCDNRRNNEARADIAVWARTSLFCRFTDTGTDSVKIRETRRKISADIRIFLQCSHDARKRRQLDWFAVNTDGLQRQRRRERHHYTRPSTSVVTHSRGTAVDPMLDRPTDMREL